MRTFGVADDEDDVEDDDAGRGGGLDPPDLHARRRDRLVHVPGGGRDRARLRLPNPDRGVPAQRPRPGQRGPVRDHHRGGLGDLQARRDRLLVRAPAARLRADRRLAPRLQPDRDRRHPRLRRRGRGGGGRAGDRHHPRDRALHRAPARQLPARLQLRRALGDPQARLDSSPDRLLDVGDPERGHLPALPLRQPRAARPLHPRLANRVHGRLPAAGVQDGAAADPQGRRLQGLPAGVRRRRGPGPAARLLRADHAHRGAGDGARRRDPDPDRRAAVRVGRPDRPADRGGDVDAGALPDREQHVELPEQAAHLHHRDGLRRALLRGLDAPALEPDGDRHLRRPDLDAGRVRDPVHVHVPALPAGRPADRVPLPGDAPGDAGRLGAGGRLPLRPPRQRVGPAAR